MMPLFKFGDSEGNFISESESGRVFRVVAGGRVELDKQLKYPGFLRFMPYLKALEVTKRDVEEIRKYNANSNYVEVEIAESEEV